VKASRAGPKLNNAALVASGTAAMASPTRLASLAATESKFVFMVESFDLGWKASLQTCNC